MLIGKTRPSLSSQISSLPSSLFAQRLSLIKLLTGPQINMFVHIHGRQREGESKRVRAVWGLLLHPWHKGWSCHGFKQLEYGRIMPVTVLGRSPLGRELLPLPGNEMPYALSATALTLPPGRLSPVTDTPKPGLVNGRTLHTLIRRVCYPICLFSFRLLCGQL